MSIKTENGAEFLMEQAKANGVACSTVKDGHVLVFSEQKLRDMLAAAEGKGFVICFVKRPEFAS